MLFTGAEFRMLGSDHPKCLSFTIVIILPTKSHISLPGSGDWQQYKFDPSNQSCSCPRMSSVRKVKTLSIIWLRKERQETRRSCRRK